MKLGYVQKQILKDLGKYGATDKLHTYYKSQRFFSHNLNAVIHLIGILQHRGIQVQIVPGPKGGFWNGYLKVNPSHQPIITQFIKEVKQCS